jgi:hypothetical protein
MSLTFYPARYYTYEGFKKRVVQPGGVALINKAGFIHSVPLLKPGPVRQVGR